MVMSLGGVTMRASIAVENYSRLMELSIYIAQFRDLLVSVGQKEDCPEHRERIRIKRRFVVEYAKTLFQMIVLPIRRGIDLQYEYEEYADPNLVTFYFIVRLLLKELSKSLRILKKMPLDMTEYLKNKTGPGNIGNMFSQILLVHTITPDFNEEEYCSIQKDFKDLAELLQQIEIIVPDNDISDYGEGCDCEDELIGNKRSILSPRAVFKNLNPLCCIQKPKCLP